MEFILQYEGRLKSSGNASEKHALRKYFHNQLFNLWNAPPLAERRYLWRPGGDENVSILEEVEGYYFAPLVCTRLNLVAELDILLLRPEQPGYLISGGDIDNKLKTLFDGLRTPNNIHEIAEREPRNSPDEPLFCLLEDDKLITRVNVRVERLLKPLPEKHISMYIGVSIRASRATLDNISFIA
ncbi:MAG: hypothetical protein ACLFQX_12140 [Candidatus Kapaibacterium sp.]